MKSPLIKHSLYCLLLALTASSVWAQGSEYLYVENSRGGDVTVIEIPSHKVVGSIPASKVGHHPDDIISTRSGDVLYVNRIDAKDVLAISTATEEVLWRVVVGGEPHHLALSADERYLYVPIFNDHILEVVDTQLRKVVARVEVGYGPHSTVLSPDGKRLYVGGLFSQQVAVVEVGTHKVVKRIQFPNGVRPFVISPDEKRLYAQLSRLHGFVVVYLKEGRITQTVHLPTFGKDIPTEAYQEFPHTVSHGMAMTRDGKYLFVAATLSDFVAVYSLPDLELVATVPVGKQPGWLVLNRDERFCYASNRQENTVSVISVAERKEIARIPVGNYPQRMTTAIVQKRLVTENQPGRLNYAPASTPSELGLAGYAKVLCSAVFVSGRDPEEAKRNSGYFLMPEADRNALTETFIDRQQKLVRLTLRNSTTRTAKFYGDQGCVILPKGQDKVFFEPVAVRSRLPDPMTQAWPMGDVLPKQPLPPEVDATRLNKAVELAFSDPEALTAAFLVVYKGQIIAERYGPGINKDTQLESWSMGKSLTATLVGLLIKDGHFGLYDPAPVAEWQKPGDPRSAIRIADLLRMSSGLHFTAPRDPDFSPEAYPDHMYIYTGAINAFEFSYTKPLQFPPNTEGRYRNSDPLTLGHIIKETVKKRGEDYFTFPQRALFDRIGIRKMVLEPDPYGNFLLTGYDYGTARNWARLGLLYLWDGVWQGERLLPEGFVKFVSTPAPAWRQPVYGGLFWLNRTGEWNLPKDAYYMAGAGGQRTFIVPSLDLLVVRMGHFRGDERGMKTLNAALAELTAAIKVEH